ncbi:MAG: hypothetical protein FWC05_02735, partial [Treponema sp.]|nr:hypothetical protein [Treponema sp.]
MCKKCVLRGFKGISALLLLSALLIGCPPPPEGGPGIGQIFFAGNFAEGVGEIELFVLGPALSSQRTLARSLTEGHELYAHVMHDDRMLRLEGAYDHISDGFVLSAREETFVYSIFGQLDFNGDFQFAEISVTTRVNDEWTMRSHLINSNPTVSLPEDGFSRGLGGVPSGIAGSVDIWIPWFMEDDNHRRWSMISPAAMVEFELDPEKGFPEEVSRRNFLHFEAVGNEEA